MHIMRIVQNQLFILLTFAIVTCFGSQLKAGEVLSGIITRDRIIKADVHHTADFMMLNRAVSFDPAQGDVITECAATWKKDDLYMKILYNYLQNPVYAPPDSKIYKQLDYDKNNRLILWRPIEKYIISNPVKTEILDKHQLLYVSPNGDFEASGDLHEIKHVFPSGGTHDGNYEFKHFLLAAGLGFSEYIDPNFVTEAEVSKSNDVLLRSRGNFGEDVKGRWELIVDPNSNFVQKAFFTNEDFDKPSVEVFTSEVVHNGEFKYARQGKLIFSGIIKKNYEDIDISMMDDPELRRKVKEKFETPLVPGSEIIDFGSPKPVRTTVK